MLSYEVDRWNEEEHRLLNLMAEAAHDSEFTTDEERLNRAAMLETMRRKLRESRGRVAAILASVEGGRDDG